MTNKVVKKFKKYKNGTYINGVNLKNVFFLELETYSRLTGYKNFPSLIDVDFLQFKLTLEYCGESLRNLKRQQVKSLDLNLDLEYQIAHIVNCLEKHNIQYVDVSLQNICHKDKTLYLIDFDSVVLDYAPLSVEREKYLNQFNEQGGYTGLQNRLLLKIKNNFEIVCEE
jgi:hypothetical protein